MDATDLILQFPRLILRFQRRGRGAADQPSPAAEAVAPVCAAPVEGLTASDLSSLDRLIRQADSAPSDDAMRQVLGSFSYTVGYPDTDPFSPAYRDAVLRVYSEIAGKQYSTANERTQFDLDAAFGRPYPFCTGSAATTGDYLVAIGHLLKNLNVRAGGLIADMGPGWGNTTEALAKLGYRTIAFEVDPAFCSLVERRAQGLGVRVYNADFLAVRAFPERLDGAIFFECFHHCLDHVELMAALHDVIADDGAVIFCGEPISPDYAFPWGIRPDGMAIWSVRKFGWLELGFREDYFLETLRRTGWNATFHPLTGYPLATCYRATKAVPPSVSGTPGRTVCNCLASGPMRQDGVVEERRISG